MPTSTFSYMSVWIIKFWMTTETWNLAILVTGITKSYSCCYAISADMQLVIKIIFDQKLWIFPQASFSYWNVWWNLFYIYSLWTAIIDGDSVRLQLKKFSTEVLHKDGQTLKWWNPWQIEESPCSQRRFAAAYWQGWAVSHGILPCSKTILGPYGLSSCEGLTAGPYRGLLTKKNKRLF